MIAIKVFREYSWSLSNQLKPFQDRYFCSIYHEEINLAGKQKKTLVQNTFTEKEIGNLSPSAYLLIKSLFQNKITN